MGLILPFMCLPSDIFISSFPTFFTTVGKKGETVSYQDFY